MRVRSDDISRFIVTAAHCLVPDGDNFDDVTITLGRNCSKYELGREFTSYNLGMVDIEDDSDERYEVKARENIRVTHFRFKNNMKSTQSMMTFDIALLELERPVPWENFPHIRPICLPENSALDVSSLRGTISGWGATRTLDQVVWTADHCELHRPLTDSWSLSNSLKYLENIK